MESKSGKTIAFSVFVFDTGTGELRRNGRPLPMPDQVARLLAILVENNGSMVSREQLRSELWPDGEVVDYDHSITRAVYKLRTILRDRSSKSDRYIDTLPKRGYRFAAEVRLVKTPAALNKPEQMRIITAPVELAAHSNQLESIQNGSFQDSSLLVAARSPDATIPSLARPQEKPAAGNVSWLLWIAAAVLCVAAAIGFRMHRVNQAAATPAISVGIVPFEVAGDGAASLAESFRSDLADSLSQIPTIEVKTTHSFDDLGDHLGQDQLQIQTRAQRLNIATILFGKFTVVGDQCQLRLELVRSGDGVHLLSLQYNATKDQLASVRDRIDQDIFQRLHPSEQAEALTLERPASPKAYAAYLRGRSELALWTDDALQQSIGSFQEALSYDPGYARAYAGISSAYFVLAQHGVGDAATDLERCREYATKAVALDASLAEAHAMLGEVALTRDWNFEMASRQLLLATELDSSHAVYHQWLSILYSTEGRYAVALQEIDKAHAADPDWGPPYMTEIYIADGARDFDRADRAAAILIRKMPGWSLAHEQNASNLWYSGRYAAAIEEWHRAAVMEKNVGRARLEEQGAEALRTGGPVAYARVRLRAIATRQGISHEENDFAPSVWHAYAGDWDQALDDLQQLLERHSIYAFQVGTDPAYEALRKNPRFVQLLARYGLPVPERSRLQ